MRSSPGLPPPPVWPFLRQHPYYTVKTSLSGWVGRGHPSRTIPNIHLPTRYRTIPWQCTPDPWWHCRNDVVSPILLHAEKPTASCAYLPRLRMPCTMPPFPPRPFRSAAMLTKESTLRIRLPSGVSRLSLPHSHANVQPLGASSGRGGTGSRMRGSRCVSLSHAPRPRQDENVWRRKGASTTPMMGIPPTTKAMETQNIGKRWVKLTVPSRGSTIHVGESSTR